MRQKLLLLVFGILLPLSGQQVYGCTCDPKPEAGQALLKANAVFVGQVRSIDVIYKQISESGSTKSFVAEVEIKFEVQEAWKGADNKEILVRTSQGGCGYQFSVGKKYLVYAYDEDGLITSGCTRTNSLADAKSDLKELGKPRKKRRDYQQQWPKS